MSAGEWFMTLGLLVPISIFAWAIVIFVIVKAIRGTL